MTEGPVLKLCISENKNLLLIVHLLLQKSALLFHHSVSATKTCRCFYIRNWHTKKICKDRNSFIRLFLRLHSELSELNAFIYSFCLLLRKI